MMDHLQSFTPLQPQAAIVEYAFPTVLQFLQSEWRRFERDRNEWDIEKSEMKARIAFLEGEKRGVDNSKMDLMKRVKMLEYALRQERSKYVEQQQRKDILASPHSQAQFPPGVTPDTKAQNRMSTYSASGQNMTQVSPTTSTPGSDLLGRAKSREFLRVCLQEISYLTASVPPSIASAMPMPTRTSRHDLERKPTTPGGRNRKSDYFPMNGHAMPSTGAPPAPPLLSRSSSVPVPTLQSLTGNKSDVDRSPPLMENSLPSGSTSTFMEDKVEDATLRQFIPAQEAAAPTQASKVNGNHTQHKREYPSIDSADAKPMEVKTYGAQDNIKGRNDRSPEKAEVTGVRNQVVDDGWDLDDDEPITVVHSPISAEHWRAQLKKAGQQPSKTKADERQQEDEAQWSKDAQDAFNIPRGRLDKMILEWDKSKPDSSAGYKSLRKKKGKDSGILDELADLTISEADWGETCKDTNEAALDEPARWRLKVTLRRHLDTVRSVAFHPLERSILSGSEDGTMRYWNLEATLNESKRASSADISPIHIYRGHTKAITSVAISADRNKCFSASLDSTVRSYKVVPMDKEAYSRTDPTLHLSTFIGHTGAVWGIRLFPITVSTSQLLASISADGSLKIWDTETTESPLKSSWGYHGQNGKQPRASLSAQQSLDSSWPIPTSLDFCPTDLNKMVVSYNNSVVKLFDIETGKDILSFRSNESYDGTTMTQINKVICHPTMPLMVTGHEDRYIRYFDLNNGSCTYSSIAHLDAVSSLDFDPTGLVLCSGGHDCSVRMWDIGSTSRPCVQEFTGHRRKSDEGVCTVQYHPTTPGLFATGGADSIVKIYTRC